MENTIAEKNNIDSQSFNKHFRHLIQLGELYHCEDEIFNTLKFLNKCQLAIEDINERFENEHQAFNYQYSLLIQLGNLHECEDEIFPILCFLNECQLWFENN